MACLGVASGIQCFTPVGPKTCKLRRPSSPCTGSAMLEWALNWVDWSHIILLGCVCVAEVSADFVHAARASRRLGAMLRCLGIGRMDVQPIVDTRVDGQCTRAVLTPCAMPQRSATAHMSLPNSSTADNRKSAATTDVFRLSAVLRQPTSFPNSAATATCLSLILQTKTCCRLHQRTRLSVRASTRATLHWSLRR